MTDITDELQSFAARRLAWSSSLSLQLAGSIAGQLGGGRDWDADAGEDWARVLIGGRVVALVCLLGPLIIIDGRMAAHVNTDFYDGPKIEVESFSETLLECNPRVLGLALGESVLKSPAFNPASFSANDLWFSSV
jgi:hypothetical protein